jgi:predicted MPP superfamily phosphohydrolase
VADRIQLLVYYRGWPWRIARLLGRQPRLRVSEHTVKLTDLPAETPVLVVGFASDFHAGPTTSPELLQQACDALRRASPDLLLLGGDFVSLDVRQIDLLAPLLASIRAPLGRFAVLGNHDYWNGSDHIRHTLETAGVEVLLNQNRRLQPPYQDIWICGLDDFVGGAPDAEAAVTGAEGIRIVLMHAPANLVDLQGTRFEVALCGHTHGGQIALPGGRPLTNAPGPLSREYSRGRFTLNPAGTLIVSVGLGCSTVPFRLNAAPEIVLCRIEPGSG